MRAVAVVAMIAGILVVSGCGGSGAKVSLTSRPAEQVELARSSNQLFSIFPSKPGTRKCVIPDGARGTPLHGMCQTSIDGADTQEPALIVTFTEMWNWPRCALTACTGREARQHTWRVVESEPVVTIGASLQVAATHSSGAAPPQVDK